jgi:hypothetical protein
MEVLRTMRYMLLINAPADATPDPEMLERHRLFAEEVGRRGRLVEGAELAGPTTATTLRRLGTELMVTDGPHAESKEHLGGYYVIQCNDLDEALEVARAVPLLDGGSVEVRPFVEH